MTGLAVMHLALAAHHASIFTTDRVISFLLGALAGVFGHAYLTK